VFVVHPSNRIASIDLRLFFARTSLSMHGFPLEEIGRHKTKVLGKVREVTKSKAQQTLPANIGDVISVAAKLLLRQSS
jgi:hypothetical protein